jgi:hypothetical protein
MNLAIRNLAMVELFSRVVAVLLLIALLAGGAGATCLFPAVSTQPAMAGCHHDRAPSHPQPAGYSCCVSRHPAALPANFLPTAPALQSLPSEATVRLAAVSIKETLPAVLAFSGGPPGVVTLRI